MRILLSAYACAPDEGSEGGVGWGWATALAGLGHAVRVLTRANNRPAIERVLAARPVAGLDFVYHDLPGWALRLKRHGGGAGLRLYYLAWQATARRVLRPLVAARRFDVAQHATFAQYWSGSPLAGLGLPLLWGPVGGGETCPPAFWPGLGPVAACYEAMRAMLPGAARLLPELRRTAHDARLAVATTPETAARLVALGAKPVLVATQVALDAAQLATLQALPPAPLPFRFVMLGDLLPHKGGHLAFAALAGVAGDWSLDVVGDGPQRRRLTALAARLGLADRIVFHGRLARDRALQRLGMAHCLLFPALHDSGGLVIAEANAAGVPVICLDRGGPAGLVTPETGIVVTAATPAAAIAGIAEAARDMLADPARRERMAGAARRHAQACFAWPARAEAVYAAWAERRQ